MIMGVNDASQITNDAFANDEEVVREIVKPQQNSDVRLSPACARTLDLAPAHVQQSYPQTRSAWAWSVQRCWYIFWTAP